MSILALDFGKHFGWAVRYGNGDVKHGTIALKPGRGQGPGARWLHLHRWLQRMADTHGPIHQVFYEQVMAHKGVTAAHHYGGYLAIVTAWAEQKGIPYKPVPVGTIKKRATGRGNAPKAVVIAAMQAKGFHPQTDNDADALALLTGIEDERAA